MDGSSPSTVPAEWRIPDELWAEIDVCIPKRTNTHRFGGGRPPTPDRVCMDAIFFVLRTGCPWKALDATKFCPGSTAHDRFQEWVEDGVFLEMWRMGLYEYDCFRGLDWAWMIMDGCMTKAPLGGEKTGKNPTDRAKSGTKRSLLVEGGGIPVGLAVAGANCPDMKMVEETITSIPVERPQPTPDAPQNMCLDKGYDYDETRETVKEFAFTAHIPRKEADAQKMKKSAGYKARRWVVERTHSWMNRFRGILIRWNKKPENYIAMLHFALAIITYRSIGLFG